jgi:hypothetical protein
MPTLEKLVVCMREASSKVHIARWNKEAIRKAREHLGNGVVVEVYEYGLHEWSLIDI